LSFSFCSSANETASHCSSLLSLAEFESSSESERLGCMMREVAPQHLAELQSCKESFPFTHGRLIYSGVSLAIQYLLPTITISVAYYQVRLS